MTTFSRTEITRARSGSFTGHTIDSPHGVPSGNASFSYSQSRREMDLTNIVSGAPGGGARMMQVAEEVARSAGATSMVTATSRPGFFKKMGFDYTPAQHEINARKYTANELSAQENNKGRDGGGGFSMHKSLL